MAGYDWSAGKSNNAVIAESKGLMTATEFAKWVRRWKRFSGCTAADVKEALAASEWHHTSKMYNRTNYYDPCDLRCEVARRDLAEAIATRKRFTAIFRKHAVDGRFRVLTPEGELWHSVDKSSQYNQTYLARMEATVAMMEVASA